ncbi:MAG: hypothetical protein V1733_04000 [bacterium]
MGLSFSRIEKELASRRFQEVFSDLRTECPALCSFADPHALIGFFHDATADQKTKNAIVGSLISLCRQGIGQHYLVLLVIMFLAPVLVQGKSLRDMASSPTDYERLKKRRQRVPETIRKSFCKYLNSCGE